MDLFAQMLTELKRAQCPVVIYGAGYSAKKISGYLSAHGITIAGYLVDKEYLSAQKTIVNGNIYLVDDFLARNECVVILGFINGFTERHAAKISQYANAKKFYTLDLLGRFAIDCDSQLTDRFLAENGSAISKLRDDLVDDESKKQLDEFICQKNDGHFWKPFSHKPQYFDDDIITFNEHEVFVDCGAYDGDTILNFIACLEKHQNMSPPPDNTRKSLRLRRTGRMSKCWRTALEVSKMSTSFQKVSLTTAELSASQLRGHLPHIFQSLANKFK